MGTNGLKPDRLFLHWKKTCYSISYQCSLIFQCFQVFVVNTGEANVHGRKKHAYKPKYKWLLREPFSSFDFWLSNSMWFSNSPADSLKKCYIFFIWFLIFFCFSPSTVLLIVAGGLQYAYPYSVNLVVVLVLLLIATVIFAIICLFCTQNTQLKVAKVFTFAFAVIMSIVAVGLALQVRKGQKF